MSTFIEIYKEVLQQPTPREVFIAKIAGATGAPIESVKHWCAGRVPRKGMRAKIAQELGEGENVLFPPM